MEKKLRIKNTDMSRKSNIFLTSITAKWRSDFESLFISGRENWWSFESSENNTRVLKIVQKNDWFLFNHDGRYPIAAQVLSRKLTSGLRGGRSRSRVYFRKPVKINRGFVKTNQELGITQSIPAIHKISLMAVDPNTTNKILKKYNSIERFLHEKRSSKLPRKPKKQKEIIIKAASVKKPPKKIKMEVTRVIRDTTRTKKMKKLYKNKCQICGISIADIYSEVHHVWGLGEKPIGGDDDYDNMLVLCPNHHAIFDIGLVKFSTTRKNILLDLKGNELENKISFRKNHSLAPKNIEYHNERVDSEYGS